MKGFSTVIVPPTHPPGQALSSINSESLYVAVFNFIEHADDVFDSVGREIFVVKT